VELRNATVLLLGGSGLVGTAIARRLLDFAPKRLIISGLLREEAEAGVAELLPVARSAILEPVWGNIFLPEDLSTVPRARMAADATVRSRLVRDLFGPLTPEVIEGNLLFRWLDRYRPDAVIDCVNTATALAYQDVFASAAGLLASADAGGVTTEQVERHLLTLELPQLIRHVQIALEGLKRAGTGAYLKVGTSGTGGMGLNIPYTHSEERPSRTLLAKSAVAGAQSLFLFLMARTPGAPAMIEIKPTATIGWREIAYGPVRRAGKELELVDCTTPIPVDRAFGNDASGWTTTGTPLESVFINVGENGVFARDEFETVTALGQMELVTPEEIADIAILELTGRPSGKDIVAALDGASMGPTYRAGYLRAHAVAGLRALEQEHGVRSIGFEMLGPPRLTKLLYEAYIMSCLRPTVRALGETNADALAAEAEQLLRVDAPDLRRQILSVGIPIVLSDGRSVLRGPTVVVAPGARGIEVAPRGWVDLRRANMAQWIRRAASIASEETDTGTGSSARWTAVGADTAIEPARMAVWIFENEDGGFRIKR
jgi:NAD(P)-dependent dehydrogenase (short-subunit alcohol dehydrogenase family)